MNAQRIAARIYVHGRSSGKGTSDPRTNAAEAQQELTDGFHLVIDALKLNGLNMIYGVPGIPITDFGRMAQAAASASSRSAMSRTPATQRQSPAS